MNSKVKFFIKIFKRYYKVSSFIKLICFILLAYFFISFLLNPYIPNPKNITYSAFEESSILKDSRFNIAITSDSPNMIVNNLEVKIEPEGLATPVFFNNEILIPPFTLVDLLGGTTSMNNVSREIIIELDNKEIRYYVNSRNAIINGENRFLQIGPIATNKAVLVPITPIVENYNTVLDPQSKSITISTNEIPIGIKNFRNLLENSHKLNNLGELPSIIGVLTEIF